MAAAGTGAARALHFHDMTMLILVRHGVTPDNKRMVFQGHGGSPLDEEGVAQAKLVAARLSKLPIAAVYSSDLERAHGTAAEIVASCNLSEVHVDRRLREVDVGAWSGLPREELEAQFPEQWAAWRRGEDVRRGGGETYAECGERVASFLNEVRNASLGKLVVCVSHGGAIRSGAAHVLGLPSNKLAPLRNTSLSVIEWSTFEEPRLLSYNDAGHLP